MAYRQSGTFCLDWAPGYPPRSFSSPAGASQRHEDLVSERRTDRLVAYPKLPQQRSAVSPHASTTIPYPCRDPIRPSFHVDPAPIFFIPHKAAQPLTGSAGDHYAYDLYENSSRQRVGLTYCRTIEESEECASRFLNEPIIGFDMEWMAKYKPGIKNNISLIQVACEREVALFHIALHKGTRREDLLAPSLQRLIEFPHIAKAGVAVWNADGMRLARYFTHIRPRGFFELSHLHKLVKHGATDPQLVNKRLVSLANLNLEHLKLPMFKDNSVRCTNWTKPNLTDDEIRYAATDAYSGYQLFRVLNRKRLMMNPCPPLPAYAELNLPIALPPQPEKQADDMEDDWVLDRLGDIVFEALISWRSQASRDSGYLESILVEDQVLHEIAMLRPSTMDELLRISGPHQKDYGLGAQWLRIVRRCRTSDASSQSSQSASSSFSEDYESAQESHESAKSVAHDCDSDGFEDDAESEDSIDTSMLSNEYESQPIAQPVVASKDNSGCASGSSQSTLRIDEARKLDRKLYSALSGLRIKLALKAQTAASQVASDEVLQQLATSCPSTARALDDIEGSQTLVAVANLYGVSVIDWIAKYRTRHDDSVIDLLSSQLSSTQLTQTAVRSVD